MHVVPCVVSASYDNGSGSQPRSEIAVAVPKCRKRTAKANLAAYVKERVTSSETACCSKCTECDCWLLQEKMDLDIDQDKVLASRERCCTCAWRQLQAWTPPGCAYRHSNQAHPRVQAATSQLPVCHPSLPGSVCSHAAPASSLPDPHDNWSMFILELQKPLLFVCSVRSTSISS